MPSAEMTPRKVIIDCDPGIDDALALTLAMFDPRLEVLAVTATPGVVNGEQATRNVQALIERLDPPRWPRIGSAEDLPHVPGYGPQLHGTDGLGNSSLAVSQHHHRHPSDKVITDLVKASSEGELTLLTLGPLSNVARALKREPTLASDVGRIVMAGGSVQSGGDISPAAEFNMFCDPEGAAEIFRSPTTKILVPLDVTRQLILRLDFIDSLPDEFSRVGKVLRQIVPFLFRSSHQFLGLEGIYLHAAVALLMVVEPELFTTAEMAGDVEIDGQMTRGETVFDRRTPPSWRNNMEVVMSADLVELRASIERGLKFAGQET
jgi:purine nucleosidase